MAWEMDWAAVRLTTERFFNPSSPCLPQHVPDYFGTVHESLHNRNRRAVRDCGPLKKRRTSAAAHGNRGPVQERSPGDQGSVDSCAATNDKCPNRIKTVLKSGCCSCNNQCHKAVSFGLVLEICTTFWNLPCSSWITRQWLLDFCLLRGAYSAVELRVLEPSWHLLNADKHTLNRDG